MGDKLQLRPVMRTSYLIQRLHKPVNNAVMGNLVNAFSFGGGLVNGGLSKDAMKILRDICSFDYMGSSEFEWGAVPAALQFIAEQAGNKNIVVGELHFNTNEVVYWIAPKEYKKEVKNRIMQLRKDEYAWQKQEHCGLKDYFDRTDEYGERNVGWIELDNGYAFFTDKDMAEKFFKLFGQELDNTKSKTTKGDN
jgi:hypothetical protein